MTKAAGVLGLVSSCTLMLVGCARVPSATALPTSSAAPTAAAVTRTSIPQPIASDFPASPTAKITVTTAFDETSATTATMAITPQHARSDDLHQPTKIVSEHLAQSLNVEPDVIAVEAVEPTVWSDTCLGLPAPELCAPGPTPGFRIRLKALGQIYTYHTDEAETFRYAGPGDVPQRP